MNFRLDVVLGTILYIAMLVSSGYSIYRMRTMLQFGIRKSYPVTTALARLSLGIFVLSLFSVVILNLFPDGEPSHIRNWLVIPTAILAVFQIDIALMVRKRRMRKRRPPN